MKVPFELGEMVNVKYTGSVAGVPVTVTKRMIVVGMRIQVGVDTDVPILIYDVASDIKGGRVFGLDSSDVPQNRISPVEPVVNAIAQARSANNL